MTEIGQLKILSNLMHDQLNDYPADSVMVLGVNSGNGWNTLTKTNLKRYMLLI